MDGGVTGTEMPLDGGNVNSGVVRVGDTVLDEVPG
jgi:hypothetical protein